MGILESIMILSSRYINGEGEGRFLLRVECKVVSSKCGESAGVEKSSFCSSIINPSGKN